MSKSSFTTSNGCHLGYINQFIRSSVGGKCLSLNLFPNHKEITETMACFYAVSQNIIRERNGFNRRDVQIIVVGDGGTPRTAAWFALNTAWDCASIDPEMSNKPWEYKIDRLTCYRLRIEDININCYNKDTILIHPHSHAHLNDSIASLYNYKNLHVVAMPCCVPQVIKNREADIIYEDKGCLSPHNKIKIWTKV